MADIDIVGPVDLALIRFPGNRFTGEIVPALQELIDSGTVRIIDLVFVLKDADGNVAAMELSEVEDETKLAYDELEGEINELLTEEDVEQAASLLEPESSALLLLWENTWAARIAAALRNADGELLAFERIPREAVEAALAGTAG
jgi:uncharacterized membrane protein